ncbi:MAG: ferritin [Candidatus Dadabacteria bacterium]|nr:ferritin [Candidatus Dadabacteria bacterium]
MLSKEIQDALNDQIKNEYFASFTYLSMAAHCESLNLTGFAKWLRKQSQEEIQHAMKLFDYIVDRDGQVVLQGIEKPQSKFKSLTDIFQQALDHEREVTGMINKLYEKAISENDHATAVELQWFIHEQVEEEKSATEILDRLKFAGDNSSAILLLDSQLGQRH